MPNANQTSRTVFFQSCLGVFQGGGCRGPAFAGAVSESVDRGVDFAGVAGASAGSIVAAFLGAGASPEQLTEFVRELDFAGLLCAPEKVRDASTSFTTKAVGFIADRFLDRASLVLQYHGMYSSRLLEDWINKKLKELLPEVTGPRVQFKDLVKPTWIVAADILERDVEVWSKDDTPLEEVGHAVRCSCSIPVFFQPVQNRYIDGGTLSNLPAFVFAGDSRHAYANRILAFTLISDGTATTHEGATSLLFSIVNTIVDGATRLQSRLVQGVHEIRISTKNIEATDFDKMTPEAVEMLIANGKEASRAFFEDELSRVRASSSLSNICDGDDEVYSVLTEALANGDVESLVFCDDRAKWAYSIYPALLHWRIRGSRILAFLRPPIDDNHDEYQRRLLRALGISCTELNGLPFRGMLLDPEHHSKAQAVIYIEDTVGGQSRAVHYRAPDDREAIRALYSLLPNPIAIGDAVAIRLERGSENLVIDKLKRHVVPYAQARMAMETVPTKSLLALSKIVRGYKYQQISALYKLFCNSELQLFEPAHVTYGPGLQTIVTPPVVEKSGDHFILVQGTTRALYCHKRGVDQIRCLVVTGPSAPLPAQLRVPLARVLIGGRTLTTRDRYDQDIDRDYRRIEFATHHPNETLIP